MQKWVVFVIIGLLVFSSFGFVFAQESFQEVKDLQVKTEKCKSCSCQGFDVDKALSEVNAKIENLTKVINQKEAELQKLYAELNRTKSVETLEKIVKLEDEVQLLKSELEFYKRQKTVKEILKRYQRNLYTTYDTKAIVNNYTTDIQRLLPANRINRKIKTPSDIAELYWYLAEDTFNKIMDLEYELQTTFEKIKNNQASINNALQIIKEKRKLWNEIYQYLRKRDELYAYEALEETRRNQILYNTMIGIVPLSSTPSPWECWKKTENGNIVYVCREIRKGEVVSCCPDPLGHPLGDGTRFINLRPAVVMDRNVFRYISQWKFSCCGLLFIQIPFQ